MDDPVLVERRGGVHRLTLNRPDRINALTAALHEALFGALRTAEADPACRAVLLTGAGRGFCSGQDLTEDEARNDVARVLDERYNPLVRMMRAMAKPIVAAVHGVAAGAGLNLALACDIVIVGRTAQLMENFIRIGLIPDAGGTWIVPRLAGDARARAMMLLGQAVTGAQAEAWGLVWRAVDDDQLLAEATLLAETLSTLPSQAMGLIKRALDAAGTNTLDEQLDLERDLQMVAGASPDFDEGVRAFMAKRPPVFGQATVPAQA